MSETLTMNEAPADQPQFNEAEQEALQIADSLEAGESPLLAGKFKDAASLEQAYLSLQKKLGEPKEDVRNEEGVEETQASEEVEEAGEESEEPAQETLTEEQANQLFDMVGGAKAYQDMIAWAGQNLSQEEIQMYDSVMGRGDPNAIFFAVQALNGKYAESVGTDGQMLTGRGNNDQGNAFRSQAELVQAMSDPRYDSDPAYRQDVLIRLENSDIAF
jgi:hypothetical protein